MNRKTATLRRWYDNTWSIAYETSSSTATAPPRKYFVHRANLRDKTAALAPSVCISFVQGEPRTAGELPQALEIEVVTTAVRQ